MTAIRRWDEWEEMKEEPEEFDQSLSSKEMIAEAVKLVSKSAGRRLLIGLISKCFYLLIF